MAGTGYDYQYRNLGKTQNRGFEATFTWHAINKHNYGLDINGNIGLNKTKIKSLGMENFYQESRWASNRQGICHRRRRTCRSDPWLPQCRTLRGQ